MKFRPYYTMELVQKIMKKTSKYLIYSPLTEKVLTEWPCIMWSLDMFSLSILKEKKINLVDPKVNKMLTIQPMLQIDLHWDIRIGSSIFWIFYWWLIVKCFVYNTKSPIITHEGVWTNVRVDSEDCGGDAQDHKRGNEQNSSTNMLDPVARALKLGHISMTFYLIVETLCTKCEGGD